MELGGPLEISRLNCILVEGLKTQKRCRSAGRSPETQKIPEAAGSNPATVQKIFFGEFFDKISFHPHFNHRESP
jgi:hypothetical protein